MKLLLDTNLFLEIILDQENASDVQNLLCKTETYELFLTDYSLHSIGLLLFRQKQHMVFCKFIEDIIFSNAVQVLSLSAIDLNLLRTMRNYINSILMMLTNTPQQKSMGLPWLVSTSILIKQKSEEKFLQNCCKQFIIGSTPLLALRC